MAFVFTTDNHATLLHASVICGYGASTASSALAAWRFGVRDRVGRAWALMALAGTIGLLQAILFGVAFHGSGAGVPAMVAAFRLTGIIALNLSAVSALALFSRVWNDTGLTPEWRRQATVISVVVALAIAGRATFGDIMSIAHGAGWTWAGSLASDVGDIAGIAFMGPVLATALAMRGGLLVWPWALLFCNTFCWLLYDAGGRLPTMWRLTTDFALPVLAQLFLAAAGIAHVRVMAAVHNTDDK